MPPSHRLAIADVPAGAPSSPSGNGPNRRGPFRPDHLTAARQRLSGQMLTRLFHSLDWCVLALAAAASVVDWTAGPALRPVSAVLPLAAACVVAAAALRGLDAYDFRAGESAIGHLLRVVAACLAGVLGGLAASAAPPDTRAAVLALAPAQTAGLAAVHFYAWRAVRRWRAQGRLTPNILIVGATPNAVRLIEGALASRHVNVLGIFDDRSARSPRAIHGVPVLGDTQALLGHSILPYVDQIVITVTASAHDRVRALIEQLKVLPNAVTLFVDEGNEQSTTAALSRLMKAPLRLVSGVEQDERRAFFKRIQDVALAGLGIVVTGPLMAAIAVAVRLDSPGPVLFRQRRHGFNNEAIMVWKFRSMRQEATDHTASRQVTRDDDRVTRVGRFIRRTSLDELPQLFNVLGGQMSMVGPRPHSIGMLTAGEESQRLVAEYSWRHRIKPGITGWAQINGSRGPVHTREEVEARVALDLEYIDRQSFWLDLWIIFMTVPRLLGDREAVR